MSVDIRKICKIFCDFIYENHILPLEIEEVLKSNDDCKWDIRQLVSILFYNNKYKCLESKDVWRQIETIVKTAKFKKNYVFGKIIQTHLKSISENLNSYFHNVAVDTISGYVILGIEGYIKEIADEEIADKYIALINKYNPNNKEITDKYITSINKYSPNNNVYQNNNSFKKDFKISADLIIPHLIPVLKNLSDIEFESYVDNVDNSKRDFHTSRYPLLSSKKETFNDKHNRLRCWSRPVIKRNGIMYYMYNQWIDSHYDFVIDWLEKHNVDVPKMNR